jgi:iron complex transport system substrate-binding protein
MWMDKPTKCGVEVMKTKTIALVIILAAIIIVAGVIVWQQLYPPEKTPSGPISVIDDYDRNVTITNYPPKRIVSLAPSCTEIIFALNLENKLVGVDNYDYYPPEMSEKIDSLDITKVGQYALISIETIVDLEPDLVLAAMRVQYPIIENLDAVGQTAMIIYPQNFDDVLADISLIGEATGYTEEAEELVNSILNKAQDIADKTQGAYKPRVYIEYSFNGGLQSFGSESFADELINKAGGKNIFTDSASAYISTSSEEVIVSNPEIIIIAKGAMSEAAGLTPDTIRNRPGWSEVDAVKNNQIYEIEERLLLPGPAMIEGLESIAQVVHPEIFG